MSREGQTEEQASTAPEEEPTEETFLKELYLFMKNRDTPIERIPHLGFKQVDLFLMYKAVQSLGGYDQVTAHQMWKQVYNKLGGNPRSTSAATCTRRHYEKLILPYERHLRGEEHKDMTPSRAQKRFHRDSHCHEEEEEEERRRASKYIASYGHSHTSLTQSHHDFLAVNRVRIIPMPLQLRHYYHPNHPALPAYFPTSPPVKAPHIQTGCLPMSREVSEQPRQQLVLLRTLAKEYNSSSGWADPLNLSRKECSLGPVSQHPSSFSPPTGIKAPKFLKVSPLYPGWNSSTEGESEVTENGEGSVDHSPAPTPEQPVIDLTSAAASSRSSLSPVLPPAPVWQLPASVGACSPNPQDAPVTKSPEGDGAQQLKDRAESPQPSPEPLNLSRARQEPPKDSPSRMEIQIPLAVLQNWFASSRGKQGSVVLLNGEGGRTVSSAEGEGRGLRASVDRAPAIDLPTDLSFQGPWGDKTSPAEEQGLRLGSVDTYHLKPPLGSFSHLSPTEGLMIGCPSYARINSHLIPLGVKDREREGMPAWSNATKLNPADAMPLSRRIPTDSWDPYCKLYPHRRDYEVLKRYSPREQVEPQDLVVGRGSSQAQPIAMRDRPGPQLHEHMDRVDCLSPTYSPDNSENTVSSCRQGSAMTLGLPAGALQSGTAPHPLLMVKPASSNLVSLTPEEYLKLKRLITSSP
ncbi:AT-rich interaction domain 6 [Amia ocellicauda]|uniref:AT-rich interaction domain 6 n=1 Tax=Amia ocellicauda TaxID=2972642 RepID=UPI003464339A